MAAALIVLGTLDYLAARSLAVHDAPSSTASNQVQQRQLASLKAHIKLCSLSETIMTLAYDSGVAMGGYSITKDPMFSKRYDKIAEALPKRVQELKQLVADSPEEMHATEEILKLSNSILQTNSETKKLIDDPRTDVDQFKDRHAFKVLRAKADDLKAEIQNLRDKDLERAEETTQIVATAQTGSGELQIFLLAIFNAICGCGIVWRYYGALKRT